MEDKPQDEKVVLLRAILAVLVDQRSRSADATADPIELLLARAGIDHKAIATLVGKKPDAVRMMLARKNKP